MNDNPYSPPAPPRAKPKSVWERLLRFLTGADTSPRTQFLAGEPVIYNGIIFHIEPGDEGIVVAACPKTDLSQDKKSLIVREIESAYKIFLKEVPSLRDELSKRQIEVHIISSYREFNSPLSKEPLADFGK